MNIHDRIREIIRGPKKIDVAIIWDDERVMWLAEATSLDGVFGSRGYGPAFEGKTVKEALINLAGEMEL